MTLWHYTAKPLTKIESFPKQPLAEAAYRRPTGLWLSIDNDWPEWCHRHEWNLDRLKLCYPVTLQPAAKLIVLDSDAAATKFSYRYNALNADDRIYYLNWPTLRRKFAGVIFSAECFRTGNHPDPLLTWIRSWDIRSACVWDSNAIQSFEQDTSYKCVT